MQSTINATAPDGTSVVGWLHRSAGAKSLVIFCHGHNSDAHRSRFITMAKWFEHHGVDCLRWSVTRSAIDGKENTFVVTTETAEVEQARAIAKLMRARYAHIVTLGHSQGGVTAIQLALDGLADGVVSVMGVVDAKDNERNKLDSLGITVPDLKAGEFRDVQMEGGPTVRYTADFFEDFVRWDVPQMLHELKKPILFVLGERDTSIPPAEVEAGFAAANEPKTLLRIDSPHRFNDETAMGLAKETVAWMEANRFLGR